MTIKAVIWDVGGVILRTEDPTPRDELAAELGVTRDRLNQLVFWGEQGTRLQLGEINREELLLYMRDELGLMPDEHPDLLDRFFAGDQVDAELVDYIRSLKSKYKIGIISNAWPHLDDLLDRWQIADAFSIIVGSGDEGVMKPDPRIYEMALERLEVLPEESVFIDDFIENIKSAQKLGMQTIHFQSPEQALSQLKEVLGDAEIL
jgi:epoxide hydrolase-like predicted phosphatase